MNSTIKRLNEKLTETQDNANNIKSELQEAWSEVFKETKAINDAILALEASTEYTTDRHGGIAAWIRFDLSPYLQCSEYFEAFMSEFHCVRVDWNNDELLNHVGPSIVISDDGNVYDEDSGKFLLSKNDYRNDDGELDETKRNGLIEAYMAKTGYYPSVFEVDRYGNIRHINTQQVSKSE